MPIAKRRYKPTAQLKGLVATLAPLINQQRDMSQGNYTLMSFDKDPNVPTKLYLYLKDADDINLRITIGQKPERGKAVIHLIEVKQIS